MSVKSQSLDIAFIEEQVRSIVENFLREDEWCEWVSENCPWDSSGRVQAVSDKRAFIRRIERDHLRFVKELEEELVRYKAAGKHKKVLHTKMRLDYARDDYMPLSEFRTGASKATYCSGCGLHYISIVDDVRQWAEEYQWHMAEREVIPSHIKEDSSEYQDMREQLSEEIDNVYFSDRFEVISSTVENSLKLYTFQKIRDIVYESTSFLDTLFRGVNE